MQDRLTWFERVVIPIIGALIFFGVATTVSFAQGRSTQELARDIDRLERQIIAIQTLLANNTAEDARARQDGFTRLAVVEAQVRDLQQTARENRQLVWGTLATIVGNILLSALTFNRVRRNGGRT